MQKIILNLQKRIFYVGMMDVSTPEILTNVEKISRDPDINFPGNGNFKTPNLPGNFPSRLTRRKHYTQQCMKHELHWWSSHDMYQMS